jgi:hypothetical protein
MGRSRFSPSAVHQMQGMGRAENNALTAKAALFYVGF